MVGSFLGAVPGAEATLFRSLRSFKALVATATNEIIFLRVAHNSFLSHRHLSFGLYEVLQMAYLCAYKFHRFCLSHRSQRVSLNRRIPSKSLHSCR